MKSHWKELWAIWWRVVLPLSIAAGVLMFFYSWAVLSLD